LWVWYSALAFFVLPIWIAARTVPGWPSIAVEETTIRQVVLCGLAWGTGSVLYGLGFDMLGMSLGFPMMTALTTAAGAFVPLFMGANRLAADQLTALAMGNALTVVGVVLCGKAGAIREHGVLRGNYARGLTIAISGGLLSAAFNVGYVFGKSMPTNAIWAILLPAGGLVNLGYCVYRANNSDSSGLFFRGAALDWIGAIAMASMWTYSVVFYGTGAELLGSVGPTLGWTLWNSVLTATTLAFGWVLGEWRGVRRDALAWLVAGAAVLLVGSIVVGWGVQ
jgi:L-rhamnose-H+ transport protein